MNHQKVQVWIVIRDSKKRTLLLQTSLARGSFWQPITGSVEPNESPIAAAERETREETGLALGTPISIDFKIHFEGTDHQGGTRPVEESVFYYILDEKPTELQIDPSEHQVYSWPFSKEVSECLKWPSNLKAYEKVLEHAFGASKKKTKAKK